MSKTSEVHNDYLLRLQSFDSVNCHVKCIYHFVITASPLFRLAEKLSYFLLQNSFIRLLKSEFALNFDSALYVEFYNGKTISSLHKSSEDVACSFSKKANQLFIIICPISSTVRKVYILSLHSGTCFSGVLKNLGLYFFGNLSIIKSLKRYALLEYLSRFKAPCIYL